MIKTIIKHKLAELAINNLFDNVINNFQDVHKFHGGQRYKSMTVRASPLSLRTKSCSDTMILNDVYINYTTHEFLSLTITITHLGRRVRTAISKDRVIEYII